MGWKRLGDEERPSRDLIKWDRIGMELEGIWKGAVEGEYGELGQVETASGELIAFPLLTILQRRLKDVEEGIKVKIIYLGKKLSNKSGREYKDYDTFIDEEVNT